MSDDKQIRLANLRAMRLGPSDCARMFGGTVAYWSDLLRGAKSFGEKKARRIEELAHLPRGSLDQPGERVSAAPPRMQPLDSLLANLPLEHQQERYWRAYQVLTEPTPPAYGRPPRPQPTDKPPHSPGKRPDPPQENTSGRRSAGKTSRSKGPARSPSAPRSPRRGG